MLLLHQILASSMSSGFTQQSRFYLLLWVKMTIPLVDCSEDRSNMLQRWKTEQQAAGKSIMSFYTDHAIMVFTSFRHTFSGEAFFPLSPAVQDDSDAHCDQPGDQQ